MSEIQQAQDMRKGESSAERCKECRGCSFVMAAWVDPPDLRSPFPPGPMPLDAREVPCPACSRVPLSPVRP